MYGTERGSTYGYSLWEFEVYGIIPASNHAPVLEPVSDQTVVAGATLLLTNVSSDADVPPQVLTYSLSGAQSDASIDSSNGVLTWRPAIAESPSTPTFTVVSSPTTACPA